MARTSILLVDDDRELDLMLTEYLSAEPFSVAIAQDGKAALDLLTEKIFNLVILDVMLPSLNGFDVLRRLRQTLTVPVIMLTARGEDTDRILGLELGADDYLAKPFNPKELVARIHARPETHGQKHGIFQPSGYSRLAAPQRCNPRSDG
jgi:two-component system, OmpR family, response regulator CpxR